MSDSFHPSSVKRRMSQVFNRSDPMRQPLLGNRKVTVGRNGEPLARGFSRSGSMSSKPLGHWAVTKQNRRYKKMLQRRAKDKRIAPLEESIDDINTIDSRERADTGSGGSIGSMEGAEDLEDFYYPSDSEEYDDLSEDRERADTMHDRERSGTMGSGRGLLNPALASHFYLSDKVEKRAGSVTDKQKAKSYKYNTSTFLETMSSIPTWIGSIAYAISEHKKIGEQKSFEKSTSIGTGAECKEHQEGRLQALGHTAYYMARDTAYGLLIANAAKQASNAKTFFEGLVNIGSSSLVGISHIVAGVGGIILLPVSMLYIYSKKKKLAVAKERTKAANTYLKQTEDTGSFETNPMLKPIAKLIKRSQRYRGNRMYLYANRFFLGSALATSITFSVNALAVLKGVAILGAIAGGASFAGLVLLGVGAACTIGYILYSIAKSVKKSNQEKKCLDILKDKGKVGEDNMITLSVTDPAVSSAIATLLSYSTNFALNSLADELSKNPPDEDVMGFLVDDMKIFKTKEELDNLIEKHKIGNAPLHENKIFMKLLQKRLFGF